MPYTGPPTEGFDPFADDRGDGSGPVITAPPRLPAPGRPSPRGREPDARPRSVPGPRGTDGAAGVSGTAGSRRPATGEHARQAGRLATGPEPTPPGPDIPLPDGFTQDGFTQDGFTQDDVNATDRFSTLPADGGEPVGDARRSRSDSGRAGARGEAAESVTRSARETRPAGSRTDRDSGNRDGRPGGTSGRRHSRRRHPALIALNLVAVVLVLTIGFSLGQALARPGSAAAQSRVAGWARDHHLAFLVDSISPRR